MKERDGWMGGRKKVRGMDGKLGKGKMIRKQGRGLNGKNKLTRVTQSVNHFSSLL